MFNLKQNYLKEHIYHVIGLPQERHYQHSGIQPLRKNR